jgi:hypothetical protein
MWTTNALTKMALPSIINRNNKNCWNVFNVLRLTVLSPASVIAETVRNRESVKLTLRKGVLEPQKITADRRHVRRKYV